MKRTFVTLMGSYGQAYIFEQETCALFEEGYKMTHVVPMHTSSWMAFFELQEDA